VKETPGMKRLPRFCPGPLVVLVLLPGVAPAADWPQFRGPDATGVSAETGLPDAWSATENVAWKVPIPGRGWSSPIVWGEKVFITTAVGEGKEDAPKKGLYFGGNRDAPPASPHRWVVLCLDLETGKTLWERTVHQGLPSRARHIKNTFASETPVTDGEGVYAYFGDVGLFALDMEGKVRWSKSLGSFKTRYGWGGAASPVLHAGRVYVLNDNDERSFLVALDKKTGEEAWRVDRDEKSNWATPFVWRNPLRTEIVTSGTGKVRSYDLDGKVLWELGGLSSITIPTPFAQGDLLFVGSGYVMDEKRPIFAVRAGASGDISLKEGETSSASIAWWGPKAAPYNPSPIVYEGRFYVLFDRGFFSAHEAATGKPIYEKKRLGEAAAFTASPWAYEGKVFCLSEDGDTFVVQAGPEFKVLRTNSLGEMCMATPAIVRKGLIIRSIDHLYRIEKPGG
jgi:outer membrane protein assembly factor BamB